MALTDRENGYREPTGIPKGITMRLAMRHSGINLPWAVKPDE